MLNLRMIYPIATIYELAMELERGMHDLTNAQKLSVWYPNEPKHAARVAVVWNALTAINNELTYRDGGELLPSGD